MVGREGWLVVAEEEEMATEKARGYSGGHWKKEKRGGILEGFKEVYYCVTQSALFLFFSLKKKKVVDMNCLASFFILW